MEPSLDTGRRLALLVATSVYSDPDLRELRAPGRDASELGEVLSDPRVGGFDVQVLADAASGEVQEGIEDFCTDRHPNDQLLIYLSCHGVLDSFGRLYYTATNTRRQRLAATAIAAAWLNERLEDCRARRQILILDCCHSGAFARGAKGDSGLALKQRFEPHGRGRVVLTASRSTEYSFEGGQASGEGVPSVFTHAIVNGLRTGDADRDNDGLITVTDLYQYVYDNVRAAEPRQTPELWTYGAEGSLLIAHSIRGAVVEPELLPEDLRITLESPRRRVRETGVSELAELLDTAGPGLALAARQTLERIAEDDHPQVAGLARIAAGAPAGTAAGQVRRELADRALQEEPTHRPAQGQASREEEVQGSPNTESPPPGDHPGGAPPQRNRKRQPTALSQASAPGAGASVRPADPVELGSPEAEGAVSDASPSVLPDRTDRLGSPALRRRTMYFWISGAFLLVLIAGIVGINVTAPRSPPSVVMGGLIGVGIAGGLAAICLRSWWGRARNSTSELLYRRERYFWISGAFLFVMIVGIVGWNIVVLKSEPSGLMGAVIGIGAAGALVAFIIGIWLSRDRRLSCCAQTGA